MKCLGISNVVFPQVDKKKMITYMMFSLCSMFSSTFPGCLEKHSVGHGISIQIPLVEIPLVGFIKCPPKKHVFLCSFGHSLLATKWNKNHIGTSRWVKPTSFVTQNSDHKTSDSDPLLADV